MKIKLDENLGTRGADLLRAAGHDVVTVVEQGLQAAADRQVAAACQAECRCLLTLDLDFGNPLVFRPADYSGIAVLRLPPRATDQDLWEACQTFVHGLERDNIDGKLWIIQRGRIREFRPEDAPDPTE
jgi:predicted nuclease of predicted toxin-antitoxin system